MSQALSKRARVGDTSERRGSIAMLNELYVADNIPNLFTQKGKEYVVPFECASVSWVSACLRPTIFFWFHALSRTHVLCLSEDLKAVYYSVRHTERRTHRPYPSSLFFITSLPPATTQRIRYRLCAYFRLDKLASTPVTCDRCSYLPLTLLTFAVNNVM